MAHRLVVDAWFLLTTLTCQLKKLMERNHVLNSSGSTLIITNGIVQRNIEKNCTVVLYNSFSLKCMI